MGYSEVVPDRPAGPILQPPEGDRSCLTAKGLRSIYSSTLADYSRIMSAAARIVSELPTIHELEEFRIECGVSFGEGDNGALHCGRNGDALDLRRL